MRKPNLRPRDGARFELDEQRLADADRFIRQQVVRHVAPAAQATSLVVNQASHGFAVKDVLRPNGTTWVKSQADTAANAVIGGIVIAVLSPDVFVLATGGYVSGLSGLTAGSNHYLSAATAGALTTTPPSLVACVLVADTTSSGILVLSTASSNPFFEWAGSVVVDTDDLITSDDIPATNYVMPVLVGAGGGGAYGSTVGGGGGSTGDVMCFPPFVLADGDEFDITIGVGGAGGTSGSPNGAPGGDTSAVIDAANYTGTRTALGGLGASTSGFGRPNSSSIFDSPYYKASMPGRDSRGAAGAQTQYIYTDLKGSGGAGGSSGDGSAGGDGVFVLWYS